MSLTAEDMLKYAEAVVLVQGSHPSPTLLLEHANGEVSVVLLPADNPPHETLAETRQQMRELVRSTGVPVVGLAAALDTYVRVAPAGCRRAGTRPSGRPARSGRRVPGA
jgi:hypothetical protein